ncbi:MAG: DivIVA domain-containing protein, partial [Ilumatobacter sp.]
MAMSFSRPDPASPAQIADASFPTSRRGFDQNEVRDFLRMVSAELGRLRERETFLERELRDARNNPDLDGSRLDDEALTRLLGEETARVLNAARESSHEIREKAEQSAARMLLEASDEATRMREEAEIEASRRRSDAAADAEAELSMAKQQGREMVNEARAYRERVLSELARRRELAREQIEQLIHGRDRLMQAFERARLVAVDVVSEMQPLGEPDEYVNLQPSTGPVPVMVARNDAPRGPGANAQEPTVEDTAEDTDDTTVEDSSDDASVRILSSVDMS